MPRDDDSTGDMFAFTSAQSAQDNLTAVYGASHGLMLLTQFSNPIYFISTAKKKISIPCNASALLFILIRTILKFILLCMYKSPCFWGYFFGLWLSDFCSASVPHATVRVIMSLTTHGVGVFIYFFLSLSALHASVPVMMLELDGTVFSASIVPLLIWCLQCLCLSCRWCCL